MPTGSLLTFATVVAIQSSIQKFSTPFQILLWVVLLSAQMDNLTALEPASARSETWLVKTWQDEDGLPSSIISAIAQTPDGYLWLGTPFGLVRFDGVRAIVIQDEQYPKSFKPRVTALHVDPAGRLWLGEHNGAVSSFGTDGLTHHVKGVQGANKPVVSIGEDEHGCQWIGRAGGWARLAADGSLAETHTTPNQRTVIKFDFKRDSQGQLWVVAGDTLSRVKDDQFKPVFSVNNSALKAVLARDGGFWLLHHAQLSRYTPGGVEEKTASLAALGGAGEVMAIYEDRTGHLWLGTSGQGLFCYANGQFSKVTINQEQIAALWDDREGNLWVGTVGSGLSRIRPRIFEMLDVDNGLPKNDVHALCVNSNGVYAAGQRWAANYTAGQFDQLTNQAGLPVPLTGIVQTLCTTPDGSLWLGTERDGLYRWQAGRIQRIDQPGNQIGALLPARDCGVWIGIRRDGLAHWRDGMMTNHAATQSLGKFNTSALAEDNAGRIWIGSAGGALFAFHSGEFTRYEPQDGQPLKTIHCLWPNASGSVWAGTDGGGLLLFDHGKFSRITTDNGLQSDFIYALHMDERGQVWFGSAQGLFRVARAQLEAFARGERTDVESFAYGRSEGLASLVFNPSSNPQRQTADGRIWFATRSGVLAFNPRAVPIKSAPPPVHLDSVLVNGRVVKPAGSGILPPRMELAPRLENIEFTFTAPALTSPGRVKLLYQLKGWDDTWQDGSATHRALYSRLPPGDYRFHVIARGQEGAWNRDGATVSFTVLPTFWQTQWFRWLAGFALAAGLAVGIRFIFLRRLHNRMAAVEREQALSRERERIAADLHDDVGASLTYIAQLSELAREENPRDSARPRLEQIARTARQTIEIMDEIVWTMNPRNDTLPHLVGYLGDYATEFFSAGSIELHTDLPENLPEIKLTSEVRHNVLMAIKESLNNVAKHSKASSVSLLVTATGNELRIIVRDDGKGFTLGAPGSGAGLGNLHRRLHACGGALQIETAPGRGTTVTISLPLPTHSQPTPT